MGGKLPEAFTTGKLNAPIDERWYPIGDFNQVNEAKGDDVLFEGDKGASYLVAKGSISFEAYIEAAPNTLEKKVNSFNCGDFSAFYIDDNDAIIGVESGDDLFPAIVAQGTLRADWIKRSIVNSNVQRLKINFTLDNSVTFGEMNAIEQSCNEYDVAGINGLYDATSETTVTDATTLTVDVTTDGGSFCSPQKLEGLVLGDFTLTNLTTALGVTISVVTEVNGVYTLTIPAQTAADIGSLVITKTNFDIPAETITFA